MMKSVFAHHNNMLCVEALPVLEIAEDIDTPFYCTSTKQLQLNYRSFAAPFAALDTTVHYAVQANANLAIIRVLADCGAGASIASAGELERALQADVTPDKIIFSGAGKTHDDIAAALLAGVEQINVESLSDLHLIDHIATVIGKKAPLSLLLRTGGGGMASARPGIDFEQMGQAIAKIWASDSVYLKGLSVQVDPSCVPGKDAFRDAYQELAALVATLRGQGFRIGRVSLGGGLGIARNDADGGQAFAAYSALVQDIIAPLGCAISLEPGRRLVGDAGALIARVLHVKQEGAHRTIVIDAGKNDLMHPATQTAQHEIVSVWDDGLVRERSRATVIGASGTVLDVIGEETSLPALQAGDLIAIMQAGAYGSAMPAQDNGRPLIPEILVSGAQYAVIRRRIAVAEQIGWETIPDWMVAGNAA